MAKQKTVIVNLMWLYGYMYIVRPLNVFMFMYNTWENIDQETEICTTL